MFSIELELIFNEDFRKLYEDCGLIEKENKYEKEN